MKAGLVGLEVRHTDQEAARRTAVAVEGIGLVEVRHRAAGQEGARTDLGVVDPIVAVGEEDIDLEAVRHTVLAEVGRHTVPEGVERHTALEEEERHIAPVEEALHIALEEVELHIVLEEVELHTGQAVEHPIVVVGAARRSPAGEEDIAGFALAVGMGSSKVEGIDLEVVRKLDLGAGELASLI